MQELTLEYVISNKMSAIDCVKHFKPEWTNEECDFFIWEHTCFPSSTEFMIKQINANFLSQKNT
jgi:hypothetical protein